MLIGYTRLKEGITELTSIEKSLKRAGCKIVFTDVVTDSKSAQPGLQQALSKLSKGDTLVVSKLTCLGRSLKDLNKIIKDLSQNEIGFKSLKENLDFTKTITPLMLDIINALAQFEKELITDRTQIGLKAAHMRGRLGGRPYVLSKQQINKLQQHYEKNDLSITEICKLFNIARPTFYRYLRNNKFS